jgi:REP element-mobilizing transposase RayT
VTVPGPEEKTPLYYTFGNHMHWVDMQWLWGYHVLPGSVRDMLRFCREAGVKGNVNFDGIGYEKLAAEAPDAFAELRAAIWEGLIEPVGCSYGQPYGQFHGGESNVRQRVYGVRTVMRLFGLRPRAFWEEEFDFFSQLPQMLRGVGFDGAALFFQWTWHTPEIPKEESPVVWWEAPDGSRLLAATRNRLNLHQWPEDMDILFDDLAANPPAGDGPTPLILQWLELMPSPDWMCRSEVLLPKMRELVADERFKIQAVTLSEYLSSIGSSTGFQPVSNAPIQGASQSSAGFKPVTGASFQDAEEDGTVFPPLSDDPFKEGESSTGFKPVNNAPFQGAEQEENEWPQPYLVVDAEVERRRGANLPHWTQEGACYHVVFRLNDAIPKHAQVELQEERLRLQRLSEQSLLSPGERFEYQRILGAKVEALLLGGHGKSCMADPRAAAIVADSLRHFDGSRYRLYAWCVMPNHVHVLVEPSRGFPLSKILHSWKSYTATEINRLLGRTGALWQPESYDRIIRNPREFHRVRQYILSNPEKAGLQDWTWRGSNVPEDAEIELASRSGGPEQTQDASATHRLEADATHRLEADATRRPEADDTPVRRYRPEDVWHGLSLGKNHDRMRLLSSETEGLIREAESLAATLGLFGRPYAQWGVYPTWELEEAWRELLQAQHHDNDECEGLCGRVGVASYQRSQTLAESSLDLQTELLSRRAHAPGSDYIARNPLPWPRTANRYRLHSVLLEGPQVVVGPCGWSPGPNVHGTMLASNDPIELQVEREGALVRQIRDQHWSGGVLAAPVGQLFACRGGERLVPVMKQAEEEVAAEDFVEEARDHDLDAPGGSIRMEAAVPGALDISLEAWALLGIDPGFAGAWRLPIRPAFSIAQIIADSPFHAEEIRAGTKGVRKYPEGDWMTTPQWFEDVEGAFTCLSYVDLVAEDGRGLLICTDTTRQWFRKGEQEVELICGLNDPWDERAADSSASAKLRLIPHGPLTNVERYRLAQEFRHPLRLEAALPDNNLAEDQRIPALFQPFTIESEHAVVTAFYRETRDSARGQFDHAADELGVDYPYVIRLVELNGLGEEVRLSFSATLAGAIKTNLLGEPLETLTPEDEHVLVADLRPFEIATFYLDLVEGRKQTRDLDAKREIWSTVHRTEEG